VAEVLTSVTSAAALSREQIRKYYFRWYHSTAYLHYSSLGLTQLVSPTPMQTAYVKFLDGAIQLLMDRNPDHKIHYPCSWPFKWQHQQKGQGLNGHTPQMQVDGLPPSNLFSY